MAAKAAAASPSPQREEIRTGTSVEALKRAFQDNLHYIQGKFPEVATRNDHYMALAMTVRDRLLERWTATASTYFRLATRSVCYLSAEYLLGPHLQMNLVNLDLVEPVRTALSQLGLDLDALIDQEEEPGLGNGGLGRLAACYLDSLATLQYPCIGYGIRYEFGIFDQHIRDGWQVEVADRWLRMGNPWEIPRPEITFPVGFGGHTESWTDSSGRYRVDWIPERTVMGMAYDTPILGHRVNTANLLRLWHAQARESFDLGVFNTGDYFGAVQEKIASENITKVLYPNDKDWQGKQLRLQQQYLFVSCSLRDAIRIFHQRMADLEKLPDKFTVQLNDTHPAIAVAEMMRILVDERHVDWEPAWDATRRIFGYTNHTLLPEALETWPLELFGRLLPRHLQIIFEINRRFLEGVRTRFPGDDARVQRMSLIDERGGRSVRMANLACVGSHSVNGVAELHSRLLRENVLRDFAELEPEKFHNVTNGVSPRRFLLMSHPQLARLITHAVGEGWASDLNRLRGLEKFAGDTGFQASWQIAKDEAKRRLATLIEQRTHEAVDPGSLFDVHAKRLHEYKRQHLNVLQVIARYFRMKDEPNRDWVPRTVIFAGKAAPGYFLAKLIIKLIHSVAHVVNNDPAVRDRLRVVFLPDFNVRTAQRVYPGANLSQQISTAGMEASGTGNMKFAMNGALTLGTLDGANIEIREHVGPENFFLFGLTAEDVAARSARPRDLQAVLRANPALDRVLDALQNGQFSHGDHTLFHPLTDSLLTQDRYFVLDDFAAYMHAQEEVDRAWAEPERWTRMSILNTARTGHFSSDRSIREYCQTIWKLTPLPISMT